MVAKLYTVKGGCQEMRLVITRIFCTRQLQGRKHSLSRELRGYARIFKPIREIHGKMYFGFE
jgi:hypothetical protein